MVHLICEIFMLNIIKLSSENSRKNVKKYYSIVSDTCFHHVISFTPSPFGVSSLFRHMQQTLCPNPRTEKLTALSKVNQATIMRVPGHSSIPQNETADRLAKVIARTRPIHPEPFLPQSFSRFKLKIRNWLGKRKRIEWTVCERYGTSQLFLEGPTDKFVQS